MHLGSGAHSIGQSVASVISQEVTPLHKLVPVTEVFARLGASEFSLQEFDEVSCGPGCETELTG